MINRVILLGNLTNDPQMNYTPSGNAICKFGVATNEKWKDKSGKQQERAEFHRVQVFGKSAEACQTYLKKGQQVFVEGKIRYSDWTNEDGIKKYFTDIYADRVEFLGKKEAKPAHDNFDEF